MKIIKYLFVILLTFNINAFADINAEFENWKKKFKKIALANNISEKTFDKVMSDTKFLPNVIKYDRFQPEFYEDTKTYISKRTSDKKVSKGLSFYKQNSNIVKSVENKFNFPHHITPSKILLQIPNYQIFLLLVLQLKKHDLVLEKVLIFQT